MNMNMYKYKYMLYMNIFFHGSRYRRQLIPCGGAGVGWAQLLSFLASQLPHFFFSGGFQVQLQH